MSSFRFSATSLRRREGVDQRLIEISDLALQLSKIDFGIPEHGGRRNALEQAGLFARGKSNADGEMTKSAHQSGLALDVFAYVDGKASWDKHHLAMVAAAMLQAASILGHQLEWGGLWRSFEDYPHFQLVE